MSRAPSDDRDSPLLGRSPLGSDSMGLQTREMVARMSRQMFDVDEEPVHLGRFELRKRLGAGAMGVVFAALDTQLERTVAVKVLSGAADPEASERMVREAKALARLNHPHVITVYEAGTVDGRFFIAMELVEGGDLSQWAKHAPLASRKRVKQLVPLAMQAAKGLAAAHRAGLVHRDIKPGNLLVSRDGILKVADFGIARAMGDRWERAEQGGTPDDAMCTATGMLVGTPAYMAPEQFDGCPEPRSDQFAWAVSFHEALLGTRPFAGKTWAEIRDNAEHSRFVEAPEGRAAPRWLLGILRRSLRPEPEQRFEDFEEVLEQFRRHRVRRAIGFVAAGVGVIAVGTGGAFAGVRWQEASRRADCEAVGSEIADSWGSEEQAAIEAALVGTGSGSGAAMWPSLREAVDGYVAGWTSQRVQVCIESTVSNEMTTEEARMRIACLERRRYELVTVLDGYRLRPEENVLRPLPSMLRSLEPCRGGAWLERAYAWANDPALEREVADIYRQISDLSATGGDPASREGLRALVERAGHLDDATPKAEATLALAKSEFLAGDYEATKQLLRQAFRISGEVDQPALGTEVALFLFRIAELDADEDQMQLWLDIGHAQAARVTGLPPEHELNLLSGRGKLELQLGRFEEAQATFEEVLRRRKQDGQPGWLVGKAVGNLGLALYRKGDLAAATALFEEARGRLEAAYGASHPEVLSLGNTLATAYITVGRVEDARELTERSVAIVEQRHGRLHPDLLFSLNNLGLIHARTGRYAEAVQTYGRAIEVLTATYGPGHSEIAVVLSNRADALNGLGQHEQARQDLERAAEIQSSNLGDDHPAVALTANTLGDTLRQLGEYDQAVAAHETAMRIYRDTVGEETKSFAIALGNWGLARLRQGHTAEAIAALERALAIKRRILDEEHPSIAYTLNDLGDAYLTAGRADDAIEVLQSALAIRTSVGAGPDLVGATGFLLAQVRWAAGRHAEALDAAEAARQAFEQAGEARERQRAEVAAWLDAHRDR